MVNELRCRCGKSSLSQLVFRTSQHSRNLEFRLVIVTFSAIIGLNRDKPVFSSGVPGENHTLISSHWQLSHMPWLINASLDCIVAAMSIHRIRNRQLSLDLAVANSRIAAFCACWCATFSVMQTIREPSLFFVSKWGHTEKKFAMIRDPWDSQVFTKATYPLFHSSKIVGVWLMTQITSCQCQHPQPYIKQTRVTSSSGIPLISMKRIS